jgi:4-oxalocrotonate tautomerase
MPIVSIKIAEGRTVAQKRGMVKDVTEAIVKNLGCPASAVHINITDLKRENFADGGILLSDNK